MGLFLIGVLLIVCGGGLALCLVRSSRAANFVGASTVVGGCLLAVVPVVRVTFGGAELATFSRPWHVPYGSLTFALDPLSAWFALPILGLSALAAIYGSEYLLADADRRALGVSWFFYNLLIASLLLVVTARNGVLFLVAWELMAITSYFLVVSDDEKEEVRTAGRIYLIASHLGTAFLLAFFVLAGREAGSLEFSEIARHAGENGAPDSTLAGLLFVLAVIGFGSKAGFMPLHVWLPEAHPVAPSHVSAVMSGVMIKVGIYGLLRALTFLGPPHDWWGWLLVAVGVASGVLGILNALAQHELKRLLAYSSVENMGIIALGIGVGLLGVSLHEPGAAVLGFAGALLHVLNHSVFKGLLFLGAGAVIHGSGTGNLNRLGGLLKRMPVLGVVFLTGSVAICGLPPLNGFISEFLIYLGAFEEETLSGVAGSVPALLIIGGLALIGGLAAVCFTKAFGLMFLGEPRTDGARHAHPPGLLMQAPLVILASLCFAISLFAGPIVKACEPVLRMIAHQPAEVLATQLAAALDPLEGVVTGFAIVLVLIVVLTVVRRMLLSGRTVEATGTWDCGYAKPTATMQYTASSYAEPATGFFWVLLRGRAEKHPPKGPFPREASLKTTTPDVSLERLYQPLFRRVSCLLGMLAWIQHGRVNLYVLYIALTIVVLLLWYLRVTA